MFGFIVVWLSILFVVHISYGSPFESVQVDNSASKKNEKSIIIFFEEAKLLNHFGFVLKNYMGQPLVKYSSQLLLMDYF